MNRNMKAKLLASGLVLIAFLASGNVMAQVYSWGQPGYSTSTNGFFAGTTSDKLAYRFTGQGNRSVNGVWITIARVVGTPPVYRIGIQGDAAGNPDGTFIQYMDYSHTGEAGAVKVGLPETALTNGTVYHLVIQYQSGTVDSSNKLEFRAIQKAFTNIPPTSINDANLALLSWFAGGSIWTVRGTPEFLLEYTDGKQYGVAYNRGGWIGFAYGAFRAAQQFIAPAAITVNSLEARVRRTSSNEPLANLEYTITNLTTAKIVASGILATPSQVPGFPGGDIVAAIDNTSFNAGDLYRVELYCPTCTSDGYVIDGRATSENYSPFLENTFQGVQGFAERSFDGGVNWTTDVNADMKFMFQLVDPLTLTLTYTAEANGSVTGTSPQTVDFQADGETVTAVAADGYQFVAWSDGSTDNPRTDINVAANITVSAIFELRGNPIFLDGFETLP